MSSDTPVYTFDSLEEGKDTLTIHYLTEDGTRHAFTIGEEGHEYQFVGYFQGGRTYLGAPDQKIGMYLLKKGEEGTPFYDGSRCSHIFIVELPLGEAWEASRKLTAFLHGTAWQLRTTVREHTKLTHITYGDDYLTLHYNRHDSLKIGLNHNHRLTLTEYRRNYEELQPGFKNLTFFFTDEEGDELKAVLPVASERIAEIWLELATFLASYEAQHSPKSKAAYFPVTLLQAA